MLDNPERPDLRLEVEVVQLTLELYGLSVNFVKELYSYFDRNYLLEENVSVLNSSKSVDTIRPRTYVLKITSPIASKNHDKIDVINEIALHAKQQEYPTPGPLRNLEGTYQKIMPFHNKKLGVTELLSVRLLEYFPGTTLDKVPLTKALCREIGHYAGWFDDICQALYKENAASLADTLQNNWNLLNLTHLRACLNVIEDSKRFSLLNSIISEFENEVLKHEERFLKGIIHNDLNDSNFIASQSCTQLPDMDQEGSPVSQNPTALATSLQETFHISGVIDLNDTCFSYLLFEVAIAISYVLLSKAENPPFDEAGCLLTEYLQHIQLSQFELKRLRICVCARLVLSIVMATLTHIKYPENDYLLLRAGEKWTVLETIWGLSGNTFLQKLLISDHIN